MIYKVTLIKLISIVLVFFTIFEILGHVEELFFIDQSVPYFEYLQNDLVQFFYSSIILLLIIYLAVLITIILYPNDKKFQRSVTFTALLTSLLLILLVLLKIIFTVKIEEEPYFPDKSIKGMAHFLGFIPSVVFLIYALILFFISNKRAPISKSM